MQSMFQRRLQRFAQPYLRHMGSTQTVGGGYTWASTIPLTKIVATIGPVSEQFDMLQKITTAGMRVMRINFSHATYEEASLRVNNLKKSKGVHQSALGDEKAFNLRAVMLDTQGPEIRTGSFAEGDQMTLEAGSTITLTVNEEFRDKQTSEMIFVNYKDLVSNMKVGGCILLDDGAVELTVLELEPFNNPDCILCSVKNTGVMRNRRGVNLPGVAVNLPPMSAKDKADIKWGIENDIDYIAASFTRKPSDIIAIRKYVSQIQKDMARVVHDGNPELLPPRIIAKIENIEALDNLDAIISEADGVMVARGDLGVEIPVETLSNVQKNIVKKCKLAGKPVIVATQMLESMQKNPRPTRAECTDVSNAVLDGADCVMLSGESAQGQYPVESVEMMYKLVNEAEGWMRQQREADFRHNSTLTVHRPVTPMQNLNHMDGMAGSVVRASRSLGAKCIICLSRNGNTAIRVARYHPDVPIVAIVPNQKIGRFLQIHRAVHPVVADRDLSSTTDTGRYGTAIEIATELGFCATGDTVLIVSYESAVQRLSESVSMKVAKVTKMARITDTPTITDEIPKSAIQDQTEFLNR